MVEKMVHLFKHCLERRGGSRRGIISSKLETFEMGYVANEKAIRILRQEER